MDAARVDRHLNALLHHGLFVIFVAISFLIQESGRSITGNCGFFTAFIMLILGIWMLMLSFVLRMFPVAAAHIVPPAMKAVQFIVFGLCINLFLYFS